MKKKVTIISAILFILINITLLVLDDKGKIDRISHVKNWTAAGTMDMKEILEKDGVLSGRENHLYFDNSVGSFQEFLIAQGDPVTAGDPLYTYVVDDYNASWNAINSNIGKLDNEITALEDIIRQMESFTIPRTSNSSSTFSINNDDYEIDLPSNQGEVIGSELQKEQFILEKEKELAQKNAERDSLQEQLNELENTGDTITVTSPYEGTVSTLQYTLDDPFITIMDEALYVKAKLLEDERPEVTEGMEAAIIQPDTLASWEASVTKISQTPEEVDLNRNSIYPLEIEFNEEETTEELLPGYHVDLTITLKESLNAVVLHEDEVDNHAIWIMQDNGILKKQVIETGIESSEYMEIISGLNEGQLVAYEDFDQFRNKTPFTTPLEMDKINWRTVKPEVADWKKHLVMGLLVR